MLLLLLVVVVVEVLFCFVFILHENVNWLDCLESNLYTHTRTHARTRAHTSRDSHTHVRMHTHTYTCTHTNTCVHTRTHAHTHTRSHAQTQTHYVCTRTQPYPSSHLNHHFLKSLSSLLSTLLSIQPFSPTPSIPPPPFFFR